MPHRIEVRDIGAGGDPNACPECGAFVGASPNSLDAAWAEAEAALPEGWYIGTVIRQAEDSYEAGAYHSGDWPLRGDGPTPAAALRALAAKLRG